MAARKPANNSKPPKSAAKADGDKPAASAAAAHASATHSAKEAETTAGSAGHSPAHTSLAKPSTEPSVAPVEGAGKHAGKALKVASIEVRTRAGRQLPRWRIGRQFTAEPVTIAVSDLTAEQLAAVRGDADLIVTDHQLTGES